MDVMIFHVGSDDVNVRLDRYLSQKITYISRVRLQDLIQNGIVQVNGGLSKSAYRLKAGDQISIETVPEEEPYLVEPENIPLDVIYEDEDMIAINKAAGIVVHPGYNNWEGTIVNALLARYPHLSEWPDVVRAGIVHRLDKFTSGVMLVALNREASLDLMAQFQQREVKKMYWALVDGHPPTDTGHVDAAIGRDKRHPWRRAIQEDGKNAETYFTVLEYYDNYALVEAYPQTGRTHQIRLHLAFVGCPIVGDEIYGYKKPSLPLNRFFLHARSIMFKHPINREEMFIDAPLDAQLEGVLKDLAAKKSFLAGGGR